MTESAIPPHLTVERELPARTPQGYVPAFPAFVVRPPVAQRRVVMAYLGAQGPDAHRAELPGRTGADAPRHVDRAADISDPGTGSGDVVTIAYWDDPDAFDRWAARHRDAWLAGDGGRWVEVIRPTVRRYETVLGRRSRPEGIAVLADGFSGPITEHGYWGSMRDRMPASQTDELDAPGTPEVSRDGDVLRVRPTGSLCLIRSGQDWADTEGEDRDRYLTRIAPALRAGMDFLRDEGPGVGCWSNRFLTVLDDDGAPTERTFGLGWWRSMADLERWSESHPTHLAIFGEFGRLVRDLGRTGISLYHEVSVAEPDEQWFGYSGCADGTGLLRSV